MKKIIISTLITTSLLSIVTLAQTTKSEKTETAVLLPLDLNQSKSDQLDQAYKNTANFMKKVFKNADLRNSTTTPPAEIDSKIEEYLKHYKIENLSESFHSFYSGPRMYNASYFTYLTQQILILRKDVASANLKIQELESKETSDKVNNSKLYLLGLAAVVSLFISLGVSLFRK